MHCRISSAWSGRGLDVRKITLQGDRELLRGQMEPSHSARLSCKPLRDGQWPIVNLSMV